MIGRRFLRAFASPKLGNKIYKKSVGSHSAADFLYSERILLSAG